MTLKKIANYEHFYLNKDATLKEVIALMNKNKNGCVVLLDGNIAVGILTQSDIIKVVELKINLETAAFDIATKNLLSINENQAIDFAFNFLRENNIRRIILINDKEEFSGIVLEESLFDYMEENVYKVDLEVSHIVNLTREVITIAQTKTLYEASRLMRDNSIGSLVVIDKEQIVGILTEKDILKLIYSEVNFEQSIEEYMSKPVIKVRLDTLVVDTISLIRRKNIRRVLVVDKNDKPIDILSNHDILKHLKGKRQEREYLLMQQAKLATMGEMIGHIAHQWRQPLAQLGGVFMNLDSAYEFDELNQDYLKNKVQSGNELIKHMSNTIEDFRNFFTSNVEKENFDICKYIQSAHNIIRATLLYHRVEVELICPDEKPSIYGYSSEFSQVILNLLDNAKDVLIERGIKSPKIVVKITIENEYLYISIKDNAGGIEKKNLNKIFDIHFTTKEKKSGSGLGLYISKLIIENKFMGDIYALNGELGGEFTIKLKL